MSEQSHTPGPWRLSPQKHDSFGWLVENDSHDWVAAVYATVVETDEQKANARLIAAAPDLLEALIKAKDALDTASHFIPAESQPSKDVIGDAARKARVAIAKARGDR